MCSKDTLDVFLLLIPLKKCVEAITDKYVDTYWFTSAMWLWYITNVMQIIH